MNDTLWIAVGIGVIVGGVAAAAVLKKFRPTANKTDMLENLVKNQLICDALDMGNVIAWFRENAEKAKGNAVFFLAKPTEQMAEMFAITGNIRQLDPEHNLLQIVVDKKENLPVAIRLISYDTKPNLIAEQMKEKDYMIITND